MIEGRYVTRRMVLTPGAEQSATKVSLTALMERVHSDGAIPPGRKCFLLIWSIVKYVLEVLRPFQYWTLWMLKRHKVTLHHIITVYNDMFDHMDGIMRAFDTKKTPLTQHLYFAVNLAQQMMSK